MTATTAPKSEIRERIWSVLKKEKVSRFPGPRGRIPNFIGSESCACRLDGFRFWKKARVIKTNPDSPQRAVRLKALREGKLLYMAVPRLASLPCFVELDPGRIPANKCWEASSIRGAFRWGRPVKLERMKKVDLIVCGSVAVNPEGQRIGKGEGYSDLEFAVTREAGLISSKTPVLTTVHPLQVLAEPFPWEVFDIPVNVIITPDQATTCTPKYPKPEGIYWDLLSAEKIRSIPLLNTLGPRN